MTIVTSPINKRTLLGGLYTAVGATCALTARGLPLAILLIAVGAYLVVPVISSARDSTGP